MIIISVLFFTRFFDFVLACLTDEAPTRKKSKMKMEWITYEDECCRLQMYIWKTSNRLWRSFLLLMWSADGYVCVYIFNYYFYGLEWLYYISIKNTLILAKGYRKAPQTFSKNQLSSLNFFVLTQLSPWTFELQSINQSSPLTFSNFRCNDIKLYSYSQIFFPPPF